MRRLLTREAAAGLIRSAGLRVTPQRLAVLEYLSSTDRHPSVEQIGQAVNGGFPTVSRAAVYNVLHSLTGAGLIREVAAGDAVTRYDANVSPHHHFHCTACGRIEDIPWEAAEVRMDPRLAGARSMSQFEVICRGRCADCAASA